MKRRLRFAALCLAVCLLCGSLCGCSSGIDELRKQHGILTADGNIVLEGATYRPLIATDAFSPPMDAESWIFVAEEGVPLLVAMNRGNDYCLSEDGVFLCAEYGDDPDNTYYCRSDRYDEVTAQLKNPPAMTRYQHTYMTVDENEYIDDAVYEMTPTEADTYVTICDAGEWSAVSTDTTIFYDRTAVQIIRVSDNGWFSAPEVTIYCPDSWHLDYISLKEDTSQFSFYATIDSAWYDELQSLLKPFLDGEEQVQALYESWGLTE